jgi:heme/copper-type cytochrome/quinol oxidase subunit 2
MELNDVLVTTFLIILNVGVVVVLVWLFITVWRIGRHQSHIVDQLHDIERRLNREDD